MKKLVAIIVIYLVSHVCLAQSFSAGLSLGYCNNTYPGGSFDGYNFGIPAADNIGSPWMTSATDPVSAHMMQMGLSCYADFINNLGVVLNVTSSDVKTISFDDKDQFGLPHQASIDIKSLSLAPSYKLVTGDKLTIRFSMGPSLDILNHRKIKAVISSNNIQDFFRCEQYLDTYVQRPSYCYKYY